MTVCTCHSPSVR
ncbi:hypothetical protein E2C01_096186 [Portunus trituberculatus]|uniref:Uncharacterized protein n=1 Tax=Portunus trituberculatus TaxID=210409 RepID=A0A5B7K246_PORTR|nr:hypothetical protein [Portunus trituberculatus]